MAGSASPIVPARRLRRRRRRRLARGATVVVLLVGAAVVVLATRGGDTADTPLRTAAEADRASSTTSVVPVAVPITSPEQIVPPASVEATALTLTRVERALRGDDRDPFRLQRLGWEQQLAYRQLSVHDDWLPAVVESLPADVRPWVEANLAASAALSSLTPPQSALPDWNVLTPPPPDVLRGYYAEAEAATGIPWAYLAAIHFLETRMGRIRGNSTAGAQGPMQFIPSTWDAYGNGGDVNDNRDAINAAARYLKAAGGPTNMDRAIFAYNHDSGYVAAVKAYAENLLAHPRAYDGYYHWQVYYRTTAGTLLLPEGYTPIGPVGARFLPAV